MQKLRKVEVIFSSFTVGVGGLGVGGDFSCHDEKIWELIILMQ